MNATGPWRGAGTALVTPFDRDGAIDIPCFRQLVERQVDAGVALLVVGGTTGESATLDDRELRDLVTVALECAGGRALVIAGTCASDTRKAVAAATAATRWGADAILALVPPYNRPPQDGLVAHFRAIAADAGAPIVLYNVPGRTGCNLGIDATLELATEANIVALKDAGGDLEQSMEILRRRPVGFEVWSGDDPRTLPLLALGASGVISIIGNEAPRQLVELVTTALAGDFSGGREVHEQLLPLMRANTSESSPIPVKAAMALLGLCEPALRPPLRPLAPELETHLRAALVAAGLELATEVVS